MAAEKLAEALKALAEAPSAPKGLIQDKAGDALTLCRRAFNHCAKELKEKPELLDSAQEPDEREKTLRCLILCCEKKTRKAQVKECVKVLFERPCWLAEAANNAETKQFFLEFLAEYPDMAEILKALNDPSILEERAMTAQASLAERDAAAGGGEDPDVADAHTKSLLSDGIAAMRKCDFVYPTGVHTVHSSDDAMAGFTAFYKGVTRLHTAFGAAGGGRRFSVDSSGYEAYVKDISEQDYPRILNFLATLYVARPPFQGQVLFIVDKLKEVSMRFRLAVTCRSSDDIDDRLPWLPPLPPVASDAAPAVSSSATPAAADDEAEDAAGTFTVPPCYSGIIDDGAKCTVVWIDGRAEAFARADVLRDAGLNVVGFHDDWSTGRSSANEEALAYISNAVLDKDEHLIAVIVNNGPTHKQMLKDVTRFCENIGRPIPFFAACTKAGPEEFQELDIRFLSKDRVAVQQAVVEAFERRRATA
eukprot:TRINITY_DN14268_c0_g2_i1.p1 TRINITY_DN14268_c0_g2~~TRINITY_DN14268_c0_g2_i1.p1  ORF type:complete len:476 (-),score=111.91 TRINITY_DN14268_c0_g2_i1:69-1496(-)